MIFHAVATWIHKRSHPRSSDSPVVRRLFYRYGPWWFFRFRLRADWAQWCFDHPWMPSWIVEIPDLLLGGISLSQYFYWIFYGSISPVSLTYRRLRVFVWRKFRVRLWPS